MVKISLLLFCAFIPYIFTKCTEKEAKPQFQRSIYEFSVELLSRLAQEKENHFVASTLSTWMLLSCTSLGAASTTLTELLQVLHLRRTKCFNNKYMTIANKVASNNESDVLVERSSTIFVDSTIQIRKKFKEDIVRLGGGIKSLDLTNTEAAAQTINDYVNRATHEVIDEVITAADLEDLLLIMIDAIFFKGTWTVPFPRQDTEVKPFYNERGVKVGEVNTMTVTDTFNYRSMKQLNASVVEFPYGRGARYAMLIFVPFRDVSLFTVIDKLKLISLKTIDKLFEEFGPGSVEAQIPRFKISSDLNNLKELLEDMGLKSMFDESAQFPQLSKHPLYVSNFIQKADIEVTEEGTVAAAVTKVSFSFRSSSYKFNANKPFLYMIVDKKNEVPLFVGAYSKPSIY